MIPLARLCAQLLSHRTEIDAARGDSSKLEFALKRLYELEGYLHSNIGSLMDYGRAWRQGERIATAYIKSTVNQLINQRMCKMHQMRWSRLGAQLMLNVRTPISMGTSNATAAHRGRFAGVGPTTAIFIRPPDPQLLAALASSVNRLLQRAFPNSEDVRAPAAKNLSNQPRAVLPRSTVSADPSLSSQEPVPQADGSLSLSDGRESGLIIPLIGGCS